MESQVFSRVSGELERLFDLQGMRQLSRSALGFDPEQISADEGSAAFARALVAHCHQERALPALVDAILFSAPDADRTLCHALEEVGDEDATDVPAIEGLRVLERLGHNTATVSYLAERETADGPGRVVLKLVRPDFTRDRAAVHRFMAATRHAARIEATGLVPVLDLGLADGARPWVVCELVEGQRLADKLAAGGPLHISEALPILRGVLQGLAALHKHGLVHGDLSAETVVVVRRAGERDAVGMLTDAGAERLLRRWSAPSWMGELAALGSLKAVAPEQARGLAPDAKTDLYAVGALAYEMLTGRPPFLADSAVETISGHLSLEPAPPSRHTQKGWIPALLDDAVVRALSKRPADRQGTAQLLLEELERAAVQRPTLEPFDKVAFAEAEQAFAAAVDDAGLAQALEAIGERSDAWGEVVRAFAVGVESAREEDTRVALLGRIARIQASKLGAPQDAAHTYQRILLLQPKDAEAARGVEAAYRAAGQPEAFAEHLIERASTSEEPAERVEHLRAAAALYEAQPDCEDEALLVWLQVLAETGQDATAEAAVRKLCHGNEARAREAVETLQAAAEEQQAELDGDDAGEKQLAEEKLALASQQAEQFRAHYDGLLEERRQAAAEERQAAEQRAAEARQADEQRAVEERAAAQARRTEAEQALSEQLAEAEAQRQAADERHSEQSDEVTAAQGLVDECQQALDALLAGAATLEAERAGHERALQATQAEAQAALVAYEALEGEAGEEPNAEQAEALSEQGDALQALADQVDRIEEDLGKGNEAQRAHELEVEQARSSLAEVEAALETAKQAVAASVEARDAALARIATLTDELQALKDDATGADEGVSPDEGEVGGVEVGDVEVGGDGGAGAPREAEVVDDDAGEALSIDDDDLVEVEPDAASGPELSAEERGQLQAVEQLVAEAQAELDAVLVRAQDKERAEVRAQLRRRAADLHALVAGYQQQALGEGEAAVESAQSALSLQAGHPEALTVLSVAHRSAEAWPKLVTALTARAEHATSPPEARELRIEAARVLFEKLEEPERARELLEGVVAEDASHEGAKAALEELFEAVDDSSGLARLLEERLAAVADPDGPQALGLRRRLAQLYSDSGQAEQARAHWEALLAEDPLDRGALKALEHLYALAEDHKALLNNLVQQQELATTPKQRIGLLERIGALQEEEFVDLPAAADAFERIVSIDSNNEKANTGLARIYRYMSRFEDVARTLERQASGAPDDDRKVELLMQLQRTLSADMSAPERAMAVCERVLLTDPNHAGALGELARLKSTSGQVGEAVKAVVKLAERSGDPEASARHYLQAAEMHEGDGDQERAVEMYRLALHADPACAPATTGLLNGLRERGDSRGLADALTVAIGHEQGERRRAELQTEHGDLLLEHLDDADGARRAYQQAVELDPTLTVARRGLGRLAHKTGLHREAVEHLTQALTQAEGDNAAEIADMLGASQLAIGDREGAMASLARVHALRPTDLAAAKAHVEVVAAHGEPAQAAKLHEELIADFSDTLTNAEARELRMHLVRYQLEAESPRAALQTLSEIEGKQDDLDRLALQSTAYRALEDWPALVQVLQQRVDLTNDEAPRLALWIEIGDLQADQLQDHESAAQSYNRGLEIDPDNRNILSKLMAVYSELRAWSRLIEVIVKIASAVEARDQLAKYYYTAGNIARRELGRFDEAAEYYDRALDNTPAEESSKPFNALVECLSENHEWERLELALEAQIGRLHDAGAQPKEVAALMDRRAELLRDHLDRAAEAMHVYEEAQRIDPDNRERRDMLTATYSREPKRYFQQAVAAHRAALEEEPLRVASVRTLRRIYTSVKRPDESWCLCQALRCMGVAGEDEERFFKKYRLSRLAKVRRSIDEPAWRELITHPEQDAGLTAIFTALAPAMLQSQAQQLSVYGIDPTQLVDPQQDPAVMAKMLAHVATTMALPLPPTYHAAQDTGGLAFLFTSPPGIGLGRGALADGPQQALAFVAARHLSYFRPGSLARQLMPTGTGLRAWVLAAIRLVSPTFPIPGNMEGPVSEFGAAIGQYLTGPQRDALRSYTQKLVAAGPEVDVKRWVRGVDLTADRVGFALSNDLKVATAVVEASPEEASSVARQERTDALIAYSTSEPYFELRRRLGIALGG